METQNFNIANPDINSYNIYDFELCGTFCQTLKKVYSNYVLLNNNHSTHNTFYNPKFFINIYSVPKFLIINSNGKDALKYVLIEKAVTLFISTLPE